MGTGHASENNLPLLGDPTRSLMSEAQEYQLGRTWLRGLRGQTSILFDPLIQEYTESLVYQLASFSDLESPDLEIIVVNNQQINAFAVPGGVIGLNAGLFLHAQGEDEVSGVIAHEIAHVSQRHFARRYYESKKLNVAVLTAMLASMAVAIAGNAEVGMAGIAATQAGAIDAQLAYSRQNEREADRVGMRTLVAAGRDPDAMPRFFERMHNNKQFAGRPPEFLLTHPVTESRIADSRARARNLPSPPLTVSLHFLLTQARLNAVFIDKEDDAIAYFESHRHAANSLSRQASLYGLALSHLRAKEYDAAAQLMNKLSEDYPNELWYLIGKAEIALAQRQFELAEKHILRVLAISPRNYSASVLLSRLYLRRSQPAQAISTVQQLLNERRNEPHLWDLAADIYGNSGDHARALHAKAESSFLRGKNSMAFQQMEYALKEAGGDFALYSRLNGRLSHMKQQSETAL